MIAKDFSILKLYNSFLYKRSLPVHVHVQIQQREIKVEFFFSSENLVLLFKKVKGKEPLTEAEANEIAVFLKLYSKQIIEKWNQVFVYHQKVNCETIETKIKGKKK